MASLPACDARTAPERRRSASLSFRTALCAATAVLVLTAGLNVWFLCANCPIDLAGDEAHYWEWSRRLDWSYYSKGPLVAYIIAAGRYLLADWSMHMVGSEALAVRIPAIALSVATGLAIFALAVQSSKRPRVGVYAILLTVTIPLFSAGSFLMTIDSPLLCAWAWALVCVNRAMEHGGQRSIWLWIIAGVLTALGILAKYTMILLLPVVAVVLWLAPAARRRETAMLPLLAAGIALLGFVPIVIWNAQHDWVSLRHVSGQAGLSGGAHVNPASILEYLFGQALVVNPVWLCIIIAALYEFARRRGAPDTKPAGDSSQTLLCIAAIVPWAVFLGFSPITKVQPNWPAPALISGVVLLAEWLDRVLHEASEPRKRRIAAVCGGVTFGLACAVVMRRTEWLTPLFDMLARGAPPWDLTPAAKFDPTSRVRGWSKLAQIDSLFDEMRAPGRDPFILADDYQLASEIAFYMPSHPAVYCAQVALGDRRSQYDIWPNPIRDAAAFIGRPCLYVGQLKPEIAGNDRHAAALPGLHKVLSIEHSVNGLRYQLWSVYACDAFAGFGESAMSNGHY